MSFIKKAMFWLMVLVCCNALAGQEGGNFKVSSLRLWNGHVFVRFDPAPAACNGGSNWRMHAMVNANAENLNELLSTLLVSYTAGHTLSWIWFEDLPQGVTACDANNMLNIYAVEMAIK